MSQPPNILLIDDDEQIRKLARELLRQEFPDSQIREVDGLDSLRQALEAGGFDIAITDYQLRWTDGLTVLREIKRRYPDRPVVMFTGTGSEEIAVEAMKAGLDDYVLKSSSEHIVRLSASVRTVLAQSEERRTARETEARYHSLINDVLDTSAVGLFILDAAFKVVWINEAMERYFGLRRADVIGQDKRQLVQKRIKHLFENPEAFAAKVLQTYERNGEEASFDVHVRACDGRDERWFEHRSLPIRTGLYAGGRIEHYYDITERKRVEAALRKSEGHLAMVIDSAMDAIIILDRDHRVLSFNGAAETMFGYAAAEAVGQPLDRFIPERFRAVHREHIKRYGETGRTDRIMGRLGAVCGLRADGTEFPVEVSLSKAAIGDHTFYTAILRDITERQRTEGLLRQTNETLSALIDASPLAIAMLDMEGKAQVWNPAAERIFGWPAAEVLGRLLPIVPKEKREEHLAIRERVLRGEAVTGLEVVCRRKDGSPITIGLSAAPLRNTEDRITGIMGIMADVTERKQMERYAGRIERLAALGQLLGGIAHEIKNPLFVLTGRLQLLKEKLASQDYGALPSDLEQIEEAAKRMAHVTERFLTLARPAQLQQARCDIRAILDETLDFLSNELMKSQIRLIVESPPNLPAIWSDPRQLQEAFLNLLLNAVQAMVAAHGRGTLTVSAQLVTDTGTRGLSDTGKEERHGDAEEGRGGDTGTRRRGETGSAASPLPSVSASGSVPASPAEGGWIEVRIQDDGPGVAPEHKTRLFEPFFSTKPPEQGTGLGLWTVRTIVMSLKGRVTFETEVGRGTTFIVRLPVSNEPLTIAQS